MTFEIRERQSLTVWLYSTKDHKVLRRHGYVYYVSERMKYAIVYVDKAQAQATADELEKYHFVRKVEFSAWDDIDMTFKDAIPDRLDPDFHSEGAEEGDSFFQEVAASIMVQRQSDYPTEGGRS